MRTRDSLRNECVRFLDLVRYSGTSYRFYSESYSVTYRDPPLWRLKQSEITIEGLRINILTTNRRGELENDSNRSQHQPDKIRFVVQVAYLRIKRSSVNEGLRLNSDEGSRSLVDVVYSSGEPL